MTNQHARTSIATGTCLTLGVAVAVAMGAVPQLGSERAAPATAVAVERPSLANFLHLHAGHAAAAHHAVAHAVRPAHAVHANHASALAAASASLPSNVGGLTVQPAAATSVPVAAANIRQAAPHHKRKHHHRRARHHHKPPVTPTLAPRTKPSASAVSAAISGLRNYVHTPFTPTASQVAQFGDEVCTAFDHNQTFAQVKATILAKVQQIPFTTVTAGAADYVVKTAVSLYCPGYTSKVS